MKLYSIGIGIGNTKANYKQKLSGEWDNFNKISKQTVPLNGTSQRK